MSLVVEESRLVLLEDFLRSSPRSGWSRIKVDVLRV